MPRTESNFRFQAFDQCEGEISREPSPPPFFPERSGARVAPVNGATYMYSPFEPPIHVQRSLTRQ